jgi:DNA-directed RNA polymerase specialized sigma24 family protein
MRVFPRGAGGGADPGEEVRVSRFGAYFPRVFAYAQHRVRDEATTRELVTEAFTRAFARPEHLAEDEFRLALFGAARELCNAARRPASDDGLTDCQRDLVSLLFDGQLERGEAAAILNIRDEVVTGELVRALKTLRAVLRSPDVPTFLRAS